MSKVELACQENGRSESLPAIRKNKYQNPPSSKLFFLFTTTNLCSAIPAAKAFSVALLQQLGQLRSLSLILNTIGAMMSIFQVNRFQKKPSPPAGFVDSP